MALRAYRSIEKTLGQWSTEGLVVTAVYGCRWIRSLATSGSV
jgi:hypothetical protein